MRALRSVSDIAWRGLVIAVAILAVVYVIVRLKVVFFPLAVALLLASFLSPGVAALHRHRWPRGLAAGAVFLGFLITFGALIFVIAPPVGDQFGELGQTVSKGVDDVEEWLTEGPLGLTPSQIDDYREQVREFIRRTVRSSSSEIVAGAVVVAEVLAGTLIAFLATFFLIKDGPEMQRWMLNHVPPDHREVVRVCAARAWAALSGFLRGAALIGLVESVVMALALAIVGADLIVPVAVLTFLAAFFPVLGAIFAGIVATLVALVSAGTTEALVIAVVALVVQQLDNDLLAPVVYGRALRLHPLVVLSALTAGGTLGGIIGAFVAVPLAAVIVAVSGELWARHSAFEPTALEAVRTE